MPKTLLFEAMVGAMADKDGTQRKVFFPYFLIFNVSLEAKFLVRGGEVAQIT